MNELLESITKRHLETHTETVSFFLRNMSAEQLFEIPAIRLSDTDRAAVEKWGTVFSIPVKGTSNFETFYSFGGMPFRLG